jgi:hypothetical protein
VMSVPLALEGLTNLSLSRNSWSVLIWGAHGLPRKEGTGGKVILFHSAEMLDRVQSIVRVGPRGTNRLSVVVVSGPRQRVIRPTKLESPMFTNVLIECALSNSVALFDRMQAVRPTLLPNALLLEQEEVSVYVDELGSIRVVQVTRPRRRWDEPGVPDVLREDVQEQIVRAIKFSSRTLDSFDPGRQLTEVTIVAALLDSEYIIWRTRKQRAEDPNTGSASMTAPNEIIEFAEPALSPRGSLISRAVELAEDFVAHFDRWLRTRPEAPHHL